MSWFHEIVKVVARGPKILFFRRFLPGSFLLSLGQLIALVVLAVAFSTAIGYALSDRVFGISGAGINAGIAGWAVLAFLLVLMKTKDRYVSVREVLAAIAVIDIWLTAIFTAIYALVTPDWKTLGPSSFSLIAMALTGLWILSIAWMYASTYWAGRMLGQFGPRPFGFRAMLASLMVLALVPQGQILASYDPDPLRSVNIWPWIESWSYRAFARADDAAAGANATEKNVDFESLLDQQPERVAKALEGVLPSVPGKPNVYFVGLGAYAGQDVFMREVQATRNLFDDRFRTRGRSVVLNNNSETADAVPIASLANLRRVLNGIAGKMDAENDILVLFLTSHGSKGSISVNFSDAPLNDLKDADLAAVLNASGIKNRVVVISACHSGSFIAALQNENTAVFTAAHADKVSFGCSNERDWTYFGDALVNHALRETYSFEAAFTRAKSLIAEWEGKDQLTPSDPQHFIGAAIGTKLGDLSRDLEAAGQKAELQ